MLALEVAEAAEEVAGGFAVLDGGVPAALALALAPWSSADEQLATSKGRAIRQRRIRPTYTWQAAAAARTLGCPKRLHEGGTRREGHRAKPAV